MRYLLLLLPFVFNTAMAQKESTVSISCYVNPELYIQASVVAQVSDKAGKISCNGRYISISNRSKNTFYYKANNKWVALKSQGKVILPGSGPVSSSPASPSVFKLSVKYKADIAASVSTKISNISQMNARTDEVKARELAAASKKPAQSTKPPASAAVNKPVETPKTSPATKTVTETVAEKPSPVVPAQQNRPEPAPQREPAVAKTRSQPSSQRARPQTTSARKPGNQNNKVTSANAIGLRVDFGNGASGLGPNLKHKLNRNLSLDAALVFFEDDLVGLGAQVEQAYPLKGAPGLNWYIGIGPQFLLASEATAIALVPVTGLEYGIQGSPLNLSLDWRPNFYLSPGAAVDAGRFGLSIRLAF